MDANARESLEELNRRVIGAVFEVANTLGPGFLEKVYERALVRELRNQGIGTVSQVSFSVLYKGFNVGDYLADIVVEDSLVVELKCVERLSSEHLAQCLNYLRASGKSLCLLVNFQRSKVEWQRVVLDH
jgi:GxxExxY protein